jgi:putative thioredoxin
METNYEVKNFEEEVLAQSHKLPVVVDFWAPWCTPCLWLEPVITALAPEKKEQWVLVKVNTDIHTEIAATYHIQGIPALRIFKGGKIIGQFNGMMYKNDLAKWIDQQINNHQTNAHYQA